MLKNQLDFVTRYFRALKTFDPFVSRPLKRQFLTITAILLGVVITNTIMIWLIGQPFDYLMQKDFAGLGQILLLLAAVIVLNQFFHYQSMFRANVLGLRFVGELRNFCMQQISRAKTIVTDEYRKGDVLIRLSDDIDLVQRFIIESPLFFISHLLTLLFYGVMLFVIDWRLALVALLLTPLFFLHQYLYAKPKSFASQQFLAANGKLLAKEDEILSNLRIVKAFNAIKAIVACHARYFDKAFQWAVKERRLNASFNASLAVIVYLCALLVVYVGIQEIENESLGVAQLVSFLIYMGYLSVPIRGIADLGFQVQADTMAGDRIISLLKMPVEDQSAVKQWQAEHGKIEIRSLSYTIGSKNVLNDISMTLDAGKSYALVGESGSGKSTLTQLLLRFVSPEHGEIAIDGRSISQIRVRDLREAIAIVWQQPLLFNDSIRNNMLLAKSDASDVEIIEALKQADAWGFINILPNGIDTEIGGGLIELSGGQKQRLQLAQALLRNPAILILDEATSALDSQAEERVISRLRELRKNKTTLLVTHRYSAVKHVDQIIYLNADGTVTMGSHEQLIETHAGYRHAIHWQTQANQ